MADGDLTAIPTMPGPPYPLGRTIVHHDPRNRLWRALDRRPAAGPARTRPWYRGVPAFDQADNNCTAEAAVGLLRTQPNTARWWRRHWAGYDTEPERVALYRAAQHVDPWPGTSYEGTSTDAPFRALRDRGHLGAWGWLFGEGELRSWVKTGGPAAIGINWPYRWFWPNDDGRLPAPDGDFAGGHALEVIFYDEDDDEYELVNSWGPWGKRGRARARRADIDALLADQGEAVCVLDVHAG